MLYSTLSRDALLDLIASTASVLGKLCPHYEKYKKRGGGSYMLEHRAQRYVELERAQHRQLEALRSIRSRPISPLRPVPSHRSSPKPCRYIGVRRGG